MAAIETSQIPVDFIQAFEEAVAQAFHTADATNAPTQRGVIVKLLNQVRNHQAFVQPDGTLSYIQATREEVTAAIAYQSRVAGKENETSRFSPRTRKLAVVGFGLLLLFVGWFVWRSRPSAQAARRAALTPIAESADDAAALLAGNVTAEPSPTFAPLPPVSQDALAAIDGNGERIALGSPSLIEIVYSDERVTALPISPAGLTDVGALRYQEQIMLSDTPVAVWLANTRLNYGIGIPRDMIRRLSAGDRIRLFTNTGVEIPFLIREVTTRRSYQTTDILKQDEIGLALFALPALSDEEVDVAFAVYDVSHEQRIGAASELGTLQSLGDLMVAVYETMQVNELADGRLSVLVQGTVEGELQPNQQLLVNLTAADGQQTGTSTLIGGDWSLEFILPAAAQGQRALVELRLLPNGDIVTIQLPELPILRDQVTTIVTQAWQQPEMALWFVELVHTNAPENGAVWFSAENYTLTHPDGQPLEFTPSPALPIQLHAGETVTQTVSFLPIQPNAPVIVQVDTHQWEILPSP